MPYARIKLRVLTEHRAMRKAGLRPVRMWAPDSRAPDFAQECARQSQLVNLTDADDVDTQTLLAHNLGNIEGWTA